jgi:hypothetical protein
MYWLPIGLFETPDVKVVGNGQETSRPVRLIDSPGPKSDSRVHLSVVLLRANAVLAEVDVFTPPATA